MIPQIDSIGAALAESTFTIAHLQGRIVHERRCLLRSVAVDAQNWKEAPTQRGLP